jgi:hypothetical protein
MRPRNSEDDRHAPEGQPNPAPSGGGQVDAFAEWLLDHAADLKGPLPDEEAPQVDHALLSLFHDRRLDPNVTDQVGWRIATFRKWRAAYYALAARSSVSGPAL